jgi:Txe/YoeB family toxin of Txe-Axe toxin-antitoxin module
VELDAMKCKVVFPDKRVKASFDKLKDARSEEKQLYEWLNRAFDDICQNAFCGVQVPKKLIPKEYHKYGIDNLWKYNLPNAWRLLYSVARDEIIIVAIVLEWLPHKEYERKFKY